jgi:hypothetical protein
MDSRFILTCETEHLLLTEHLLPIKHLLPTEHLLLPTITEWELRSGTNYYKTTTQKFNIGHTVLSRYHQDKTTSRATANSEYCQLLTNIQEQ